MTHPNGPAAAGTPAATMTPAQAAQPALPQPPARKPVIPKRVTCPVCQTSFEPRSTSGACPVCGEQVLPAADVVRVVPGLTPAWAWFTSGGWRLVLLLAVVLYQIILFFFVLGQMKAAGVL
jgi:hypothetical protein